METSRPIHVKRRAFYSHTNDVLCEWHTEAHDLQTIPVFFQTMLQLLQLWNTSMYNNFKPLILAKEQVLMCPISQYSTRGKSLITYYKNNTCKQGQIFTKSRNSKLDVTHFSVCTRSVFHTWWRYNIFIGGMFAEKMIWWWSLEKINDVKVFYTKMCVFIAVFSKLLFYTLRHSYKSS